MKMLKFFVVPLLALTLTACGTTGGLNLPTLNLPQIANAITNGVPDPVTATNVYQIKQGYAAALQLMVSYRNYCYETNYATLMADPIRKPICQNRRSVVRAMQSAEAKAKQAVGAVDTFVTQHPTLDASALIAAASQAVAAFKLTVPRVASN